MILDDQAQEQHLVRVYFQLFVLQSHLDCLNQRQLERLQIQLLLVHHEKRLIKAFVIDLRPAIENHSSSIRQKYKSRNTFKQILICIYKLQNYSFLHSTLHRSNHDLPLCDSVRNIANATNGLATFDRSNGRMKKSASVRFSNSSNG